MATPLNLQVFTSGPQTFSATSSLVSGARDAVLIDAQFTLSEAHRLAALNYETGKRLTTIYITHGHPDHYFGLTVLKQAFPGARAVTAPEVLEVINETAAAKVAQWKATLRGQHPGRAGPPGGAERRRHRARGVKTCASCTSARETLATAQWCGFPRYERW